MQDEVGVYIKKTLASVKGSILQWPEKKVSVLFKAIIQFIFYLYLPLVGTCYNYFFQWKKRLTTLDVGRIHSSFVSFWQFSSTEYLAAQCVI